MSTMDNNNQESLNTSLTTLRINEASSSSIPSVSQERTTSDSISTNNRQKEIAKITENTKKQILRRQCRNVPEKIIICLDTYIDPEYTPFKTADESAYSPMYILKRIVEFFVHNKHFIDQRHEFALLTLDKRNVKWLQEFTSLPRDIIKSLNKVTFGSEQDEEYDLSVLLDKVWQMVSIPKQETDLNNPPPYVVRLILLYNRSFCVPVIKKSFKELLENPYFIIDVISTYEETTEKTKLTEIFNNLQIDEKGYFYNFWVGRDAKLLHEAMAKLLAHPLQRPIQSEILSYAAPVFEKED